MFRSEQNLSQRPLTKVLLGSNIRYGICFEIGSDRKLCILPNIQLRLIKPKTNSILITRIIVFLPSLFAFYAYQVLLLKSAMILGL